MVYGREECEEDVAETEGRDKKKKQGRNRPPFVKCLTTKQNFTITELCISLSLPPRGLWLAYPLRCRGY